MRNWRKNQQIRLILVLTLAMIIVIIRQWPLNNSWQREIKVLPEHGNEKENTTQTNCLKFIQHHLRAQITDASLGNLSESCANEMKIGHARGTFNSTIFTKETFRNVDCPIRYTAFLKGVNKPKTALASFPGSGNTWVRHLLEQVTGIWTGSVYAGVAGAVLRGENACATGGGVFIIKTHDRETTVKEAPSKNCTKNIVYYRSAILILRNPYNAIFAEFNRNRVGKTNVMGKDEFTNQSGHWHTFSLMKIGMWKMHAQYWLTKYHGGPVHVLFYEDLQADLAPELYKLMAFLDMPVTYQTLCCTVVNSEGAYHRKPANWTRRTKLYSDDVQTYCNARISEVEMLLAKKGIHHREKYRYTGA